MIVPPIYVFEPSPNGTGLPLAGFCIHAGFESPGADYEEERICLDEYVTNYPHATFYIKVKGDCMKDSGIHEDDLLVLNRHHKPLNGDVIVGTMHGDFVMGAYIIEGQRSYLVSDNSKLAKKSVISLDQFSDFNLVGVISHTILDLRRQCFVRAHRLQQFLRQL